MIKYFRFKSINTRLLLSYFIVLFLVTSVFFYIEIFMNRNDIFNIYLEHFTFIADNRVKQLDTFFIEYKQHVKLLSKLPFVQQAMMDYNSAFDPVQYDEIEKKHQSNMKTIWQDLDFYDLFLIDKSGNVVFSIMHEKDFLSNLYSGEYRDSELARVFKQVHESNEISVSKYRFYPPSNKPAAFFCVPVYSEEQAVSGYFAVQIKMQSILKNMQDYSDLGATGEVLIGNLTDSAVMFIAPLRYDSDAAFKRIVPLGSPVALPMQAAVQGKNGKGLSVDYRGEKIAAVWRYSKETDWGLVIKMDRDEVFEPIDRKTGTFITISLAAFVIAILIGLFNSRSIAKPIQKLHLGIEKVGEGNLNYRIRSQAYDEIGQLSRSFDAMIEQLQQLTASRDELNEEIEKRIGIEKNLRLYLQIIESSPVTIIITDPSGGILFVNNQFSKDTGYGRDEVIGKNPRLLKSDEHSPEFFKAMWDTILQKKTWYDRICNKRKDHELIWHDVMISPLANNQGEITHFISIQSDLTEKIMIEQEKLLNYQKLKKAQSAALSMLQDSNAQKKRAEDALKELRQSHEEIKKLSLAVEQSPTTIVITDTEGSIEYVNQTFTKITGYTREEAIGSNPRILKSGEHPAAFYKELWDTILAGKNWSSEIVNKNKNGELYWEFAQIAPVLNEQKKVTNFIAIKENITHRKEFEQQLKIAKDTAEKANQAKSDFLANMSHEIRTPMNAILGLNYLLQKTELSAKQSDYAKKIERSTENLLGIINDILDFSKIEAGKIDMESTNFDLSDVLDNISNIMIVKAQEKKLDLIITKNTDVPVHLVGDQLRLGQVLINLSSNALKFTEKGEIEVKVEKIKISKKGTTLKFSVRDTGVGLSEEQIGNLFQEFQQADTSTTRKYGGTGLGLAISKKLVELMNGKIGVDSVPGEGSIFYFTAEFGVFEKNKAWSQIIPGIQQGLKVLIVDDNETVLEVLKAYCEDFSFDVQTAVNGKDALEILYKDDSIALVVMDWKLLGMDGVETSRRIKNDPKIIKKPKIILITGAGPDAAESLKEKEVDNILFKPITQSKLLNMVVTTFEKSIKRETVTGKPRKKSVKLETVRGASLLLVEDNEINQQVVVEILESEGFVVEVADNGQIAVDKITEKGDQFDLILMDLQMPVMDGYTAAKTIRKDKKWDSLPIVAMTADAMSGVEEKVRAIGMNDYITKPIDVDEFYKKLLKWLNPKTIHKVSFTIQNSRRKKSAGLMIPRIAGIDTDLGLTRVAGNQKMYLKILHQFAEMNSDFINNVKQVVIRKDQETAIRLVHTLKGVSGSIGATQLYLAIAEFEAVLKTNFFKKKLITEHLDKLNTQLEPILIQIEKHVKDSDRKITGPMTQTGKLNVNDVKGILVDLKRTLEQYSAQAPSHFDQLRNMLFGYGYDQYLAELEKHINFFDFEKALEVLLSLTDNVIKGK